MMGSTRFQGLMLSVLFPDDRATAPAREPEADATPPAREVIPIPDRPAGPIRTPRAAARVAECCPA